MDRTDKMGRRFRYTWWCGWLVCQPDHPPDGLTAKAIKNN